MMMTMMIEAVSRVKIKRVNEVERVKEVKGMVPAMIRCTKLIS